METAATIGAAVTGVRRVARVAGVDRAAKAAVMVKANSAAQQAAKGAVAPGVKNIVVAGRVNNRGKVSNRAKGSSRASTDSKVRVAKDNTRKDKDRGATADPATDAVVISNAIKTGNRMSIAGPTALTNTAAGITIARAR